MGTLPVNEAVVLTAVSNRRQLWLSTVPACSSERLRDSSDDMAARTAPTFLICPLYGFKA
jgi:hypothetical protein